MAARGRPGRGGPTVDPGPDEQRRDGEGGGVGQEGYAHPEDGHRQPAERETSDRAGLEGDLDHCNAEEVPLAGQDVGQRRTYGSSPQSRGQISPSWGS